MNVVDVKSEPYFFIIKEEVTDIDIKQETSDEQTADYVIMDVKNPIDTSSNFYIKSEPPDKSEPYFFIIKEEVENFELPDLVPSIKQEISRDQISDNVVLDVKNSTNSSSNCYIKSEPPDPEEKTSVSYYAVIIRKLDSFIDYNYYNVTNNDVVHSTTKDLSLTKRKEDFVGKNGKEDGIETKSLEKPRSTAKFVKLYGDDPSGTSFTSEKNSKSSEKSNLYNGKDDNMVLNCRIRTGKKPYSCEKSLKGNSAFNRHRRIHTGEKPYQCGICLKFFRVKCNLVTHRRIHTGEKPYQCDICKKSYYAKTGLISHRRTHTGEKPYQCEICKKSFSYKCNLAQHRRIHTGEKTYQCDICGKLYTEKRILVVHRRIHTGEKPYQCEICEKTFRYKSNLIAHSVCPQGRTTYTQ